jgi:peptide-methionine (S)-S-oxide reductase
VKAGTVAEPVAEVFTGKTDTATFAMGCFWHSEEIFLEIKGVVDALPGYSGGTESNPNYEQVGTGSTRYAESVNVIYDPKTISYQKLLEIFFAEHDPTTPDMAYPDEGPQYRSAVFYHNASQKQEADSYISSLAASRKYSGKIVTEVSPFKTFYRAEDYHLRYFRHHPDQPYVAHVTTPEVMKFRKDFPDLVRLPK